MESGEQKWMVEDRLHTSHLNGENLVQRIVNSIIGEKEHRGVRKEAIAGCNYDLKVWGKRMGEVRVIKTWKLRGWFDIISL